ncbi:MAG: hypothetical protein JXB32_06555 [Deltaproteobacteria bacterium]|nr:hypothetical protein [Deltaproteobacteria bacterium]
MPPSRRRALLVVFAVARALGACDSAPPGSDVGPPDVPERDDAGTDGDPGDVPDGDVGDADAPPLPTEEEDNDPLHGGTAQRVTAPIALTGTIGPPSAERPDLDGFLVTGAAGSLLRVEAFPTSARGLDLAVRLLRLDGDGTMLWERRADDPAVTSVRRDGFLPADGDYLVLLSDRRNFGDNPAAWFGGSRHAYQLTISLVAGPSLEAAALPFSWSGSLAPSGAIQVVRAAVPTGTRLEARWSGSNAERFAPLLTVFDPVAAEVVAERDAAGGPLVLLKLRAPAETLLLALDHTRAADSALVPVGLELRALEEGVEAEPNDEAASADECEALPCEFAGTIAAPGSTGVAGLEDRDLYRFPAARGTACVLEVVRDGGAAGALDPHVAALRPPAVAGPPRPENPLALADDSPHRGDLDARLLLVPRNDGPLLVEVRDARNVAAEREGRTPTAGGADAGYRLRLTSSAAPPVATDLGTLSGPEVRDAVAAVGGTAEGWTFDAPAGLPLALELTDLSPATDLFQPLAYLTDVDGTRVLRQLAPERGGSAAAHAFVDGPGGRLHAADRWGAGGADFAYRLGLRPLPADDAVEAGIGNDTPATAQPVSWEAGRVGVVVRGTLDRSTGTGPDALDLYRVTLAPGARLVAFTGPDADEMLDTVLRLRDPDGTLLAENDDVAGSETLFSEVAAEAGAVGAVLVEVSAWGTAPRGAYALFVGTP